jgi:Protein of unknown function (DUF4197)
MLRSFFLLSVLFLFNSCDVEQVLSQTTGLNKLSSEEAALGLKQALEFGITRGAEQLAQKDGYFKNPVIKIPFPPEAEKVANSLRNIGLGSLVDDIELSINRAAEDAAKKAVPIFVDAIKKMTFSDAMNILFGDNHAATNYLKGRTTQALTGEFKPVIQTSLDKVNATKYWTDAITAYNKIPFIKKMNPDLVDYVNEKALEGLFHVVAQEEEKIRENPVERTTDLLKKVFNYYDQNK